MGEPRGANLAPVGPLTAVADDVHAHLALGRLDGGICLAGRDAVALGVEQEVVDKGFHVFFHGSPGWGGDLIVLNAHGARRHFVQALVNDAQALTELLHAAQVAVVAIAVNANGDVKLDLVVSVVGLRFPHVPGHAGATQHDAAKGVVECIGSGDDPDALRAAFPYTVVREEFFGFVYTVTELRGPLIDVVEKAEGEVLVHTAGADVGRVEAGAGDPFVEFLQRM